MRKKCFRGLASTFATTFLLAALANTPALADKLKIGSQMNAVTLYPAGATVSRKVSAKIPQGSHVIVVEDLPAGITTNSLRVEGLADQAVQISSVDLREVTLSRDNTEEKRKEIESAIQKLDDKNEALKTEAINIKRQTDLLRALAKGAVAPTKSETGSSTLITSEELNNLLELTEKKLLQYSTRADAIRIERRNIDNETLELARQLEQLAPRKDRQNRLSIHVDSVQDSKVDFFIRYNVDGAGWQPVYDVRLDLGSKAKGSKIQLTRRAEVRQSTPENWDNVSLTLSTARPSAQTSPGQLAPFYIRPLQTKRRDNLAAKLEAMKKMQRTELDGVVADAEEPKEVRTAEEPIVEKPVETLFEGFLAEYKIGSKVSVDNRGTTKNVLIADETYDTEIIAHAIPVLNPYAYLTAKITLKGETPYLPGNMLISRGGIFLGKSKMPQLNPGETQALSFGRDDLIRIDRKKVREKQGDEGFISTVNTQERRFVTTIENLHDFPMTVTIQDRLPNSTHEDIIVNMVEGSTPPTTKDVDKKVGVFEWKTKLDGKQKADINFGYKISWPRDMRITPLR